MLTVSVERHVGLTLSAFPGEGAEAGHPGCLGLQLPPSQLAAKQTLSPISAFHLSSYKRKSPLDLFWLVKTGT